VVEGDAVVLRGKLDQAILVGLKDAVVVSLTGPSLAASDRQRRCRDKMSRKVSVSWTVRQRE
jgi:hypothetical protein